MTNVGGVCRCFDGGEYIDEMGQNGLTCPVCLVLEEKSFELELDRAGMEPGPRARILECGAAEHGALVGGSVALGCRYRRSRLELMLQEIMGCSRNADFYNNGWNRGRVIEGFVVHEDLGFNF